MKRILLLLSLLFAPSAVADEITSYSWNTSLDKLQVQTRSNGQKTVGEQTIAVVTGGTLTPNSGTCTSDATRQVTWIKTGRQLTAQGLAGCSAVSGTISNLSLSIPNGWTCLNAGSGVFTDRWVSGTMCQWTSSSSSLGGSSNAIVLSFANTSLAATTITTTGACWLNFQCLTAN